jgi:hypothetical protein
MCSKHYTERTRIGRIGWRHFVDHDEEVIWLRVVTGLGSAISSVFACNALKRLFPHYECHYATDEFLNRKERGEPIRSGEKKE